MIRLYTSLLFALIFMSLSSMAEEYAPCVGASASAVQSSLWCSSDSDEPRVPQNFSHLLETYLSRFRQAQSGSRVAELAATTVVRGLIEDVFRGGNVYRPAYLQKLAYLQYRFTREDPIGRLAIAMLADDFQGYWSSRFQVGLSAMSNDGTEASPISYVNPSRFRGTTEAATWTGGALIAASALVFLISRRPPRSLRVASASARLFTRRAGLSLMAHRMLLANLPIAVGLVSGGMGWALRPSLERLSARQERASVAPAEILFLDVQPRDMTLSEYEESQQRQWVREMIPGLLAEVGVTVGALTLGLMFGMEFPPFIPFTILVIAAAEGIDYSMTRAETSERSDDVCRSFATLDRGLRSARRLDEQSDLASGAERNGLQDRASTRLLQAFGNSRTFVSDVNRYVRFLDSPVRTLHVDLNGRLGQLIASRLSESELASLQQRGADPLQHLVAEGRLNASTVENLFFRFAREIARARAGLNRPESPVTDRFRVRAAIRHYGSQLDMSDSSHVTFLRQFKSGPMRNAARAILREFGHNRSLAAYRGLSDIEALDRFLGFQDAQDSATLSREFQGHCRRINRIRASQSSLTRYFDDIAIVENSDEILVQASAYFQNLREPIFERRSNWLLQMLTMKDLERLAFTGPRILDGGSAGRPAALGAHRRRRVR